MRSDKFSFIRAYSQCIGSLSNQMNSVAWWATWLASKNRFLSRVNKLLEELFLEKPRPLTNQSTLGRNLRHGYMLTASFLKAVAYSIVALHRIVMAQVTLGRKTKGIVAHLSKEPVYLVKTFAYAHSFAGQDFRDVFFERLPDYLRREKRARVLTVFDPIGCFGLARKSCARLERVLPYHVFLRWSDLMTAWALLVRGLLKPFPSRVDFLGHDVRLPLRRQYQLDLMSPNGVFSLLMHLAFRRIARALNVTRLLLTFENNPWERMCIQAFREASPQTKILGYQHTVIPEASLNMFPAKEECEIAPSPDTILTVGDEPARILREYGRYDHVPIQTSCALRFEYLERIRAQDGPVKKTLLIALEGVWEAVQMLDEVLRQMENRRDWTLIIRTHPALPFARIKSRLKTSLASLPHVTISDREKLDDDMDLSGAVAYWGSSVSLEAMKRGLPVIHFDAGGLLSYDPLFRCPHLKWTFRAKGSLSKALDEIDSLTPQKLAKEREMAHGYLRDYFAPVTPEGLDRFQ
jgi:hypothetical protein